MSESLTKIESQAVAKQPPSVADMLQAVIDRGVSADNVAALEQLVGLYERLESKKAEAAFAAAFVALQAEMPAVKAKTPVPNKDGSVRYRFAAYEEIMEQVSPLLQKHGFTVTFSTDFGEGRLIKTCVLQHVGGHSKTNKFAVRIGGGPPSATETQADGAASTYAKRFALCDCLNIAIDHDTDARAEGGTITPEQAADLKRRVMETGSSEEFFLKYAGSPDYEHIASAKYALLDAQLRRKEKTT